jgi:hypothetical protein
MGAAKGKLPREDLDFEGQSGSPKVLEVGNRGTLREYVVHGVYRVLSRWVKAPDNFILPLTKVSVINNRLQRSSFFRGRLAEGSAETDTQLRVASRRHRNDGVVTNTKQVREAISKGSRACPNVKPELCTRPVTNLVSGPSIVGFYCFKIRVCCCLYFV